MHIERVRIGESPREGNTVRLSADVRYVDDTSEALWLDVPESHADAVRNVADPFMAWLAPLAAQQQESLHSNVACDELLLSNLRELGRVWRAWFQMNEVSITATSEPLPVRRDGGVCSLFTGGVDSFFTVLRHAAGHGTPANLQIDDLVYVHGFDVPLNNVAGASRVIDSLTRAADALGRGLVVVQTNLRESRFGLTDWSRHTHGAALAGVLHALGGRYHTGLIGSSAGYRDLRVWGSHPLTDPMFTSGQMTIIHDGPAFMRLEKTEYVAQSEIALRHLRVCYVSATGDNCGACNNCYRTMLALDALGVLDACATFERSSLDLRRVERIFCRHDFDIRQFGYVRDVALRHGRHDIARAVERALSGSARLARRIALLRKLRDAPLFWRFAPTWERRLLSSWIAS